MDDDSCHSSCINCTFTGNTASLRGGAIRHWGSNDPAHALRLWHCTFTQCGSELGGAIFVAGRTGLPIEVVHCVFEANAATKYDGGAIHIEDGNTSVQVASSTFTNCTANGSNGDGGAISNNGVLSIVSSVFNGNQTLHAGGGIRANGNANATLVNCTFANNTAGTTDGGGGLSKESSAQATIQNCIFWGNSANGDTGETGQLDLPDPATYTLSNSCIQGRTELIGTDLISDDPLFVGTGENPLSLGAGSPCVDAGLVEAVPFDTMDVDEDADTSELAPDVLLTDRIVDVHELGEACGRAVDMGAFEAASLFDCDGDGIIDTDEIAANPALDTNGDGIVDECQNCDWPEDTIPDPTEILNCTGDPGCQDCNQNCIPDACDIDSGLEQDCDTNGVPDACDIAADPTKDCNGNGILDECDITSGYSPDCNENDTPDECDVALLDCNDNGTPDDCDIDRNDPDGDGEFSLDANENEIPDECEVVLCPIEVVFIIDTSGSTGEEDANLTSFCQNVAWPLVIALDDEGILTRASYLSIVPDATRDSCGDDTQWWKTNTSVLNEFQDFTGTVPVPGDGSCGPIGEYGTGTDGEGESWGPATAVVADGWPWQPRVDARRVIITLSDEGACRGDPCNSQDHDAVSNAVDVANANGVTTYCVVGRGAIDSVEGYASQLATGTGGLWFSVADSDESELADDYADIADDLIAALLECNDCNTNGVMDGYECTRGNMVDTDAPELVNGYDIQDFVTCLINGDPSPDGCYCADMDDDRDLDMNDVECFVELLLTGTTECTVNPCLWEDEGEGLTEAMVASPDCNENGRTDSHDLILGSSQDANNNGIPDECDIAAETSADINTNGIPDESEQDLNGNGVPDDVDIATATSADLNSNGIPDEAEDCNGNGYPDDWEIAQSITADCNNNGTPDDCDDDCNANGVPDDCEIDPTDPDGDGLVSPDCNGNGTPDDCDFDWLLAFSLDCNENGVPDECDIASGTSQDCNNNGFPDECDIASSISADTNSNGVPDECESLAPLGGGVPLAAESYSFPLSGGFAAPLDESEAWAEFYTWHWSQDWGSASPLTGAEQFSLMVNKLQELGLPVDASSL